MSELRVEPDVLHQEAARQLDRALQLADVANMLRSFGSTTGETVSTEFDAAIDRFVDVWSWTLDRMVDTTDGIGHSIRTGAYRYTDTDRAIGTALGALFFNPTFGRGW
jgi:Excreted virulence factor EspC, type VII ESX diderm